MQDLTTRPQLGKLTEAELDAIHARHFPPARYAASPLPFSAACAASRPDNFLDHCELQDLQTAPGVLDEAPAPAEASTDLGLGEDDYDMSPLAWLVLAAAIVAAVIAAAPGFA